MNYTQEQYDIACNINLVEYLTNNGYELKHKGKELCLKQHDSLVINPENNKWYWHSRGMGGTPIQFLQEYENKSLVASVLELSGINAYTQNQTNIISQEEKINRKMILPEKNQDNKRVIAYLTQTRGLDDEVVNHMIKVGQLYEDKKNHNCVFVGIADNQEKYASLRSSTTNGKIFKQDVKNSDKSVGFSMSAQNSKRVYVFESPIDLLSHCTLVKLMTNLDYKNQNRVSLGGLSEKALDTFLSNNPQIKAITFCLDNDQAGADKVIELCKKYYGKYILKANLPEGKDINEDLINLKKKHESNKTKGSIDNNVKNAEEKSKNNSVYISKQVR